MNGSLSGKHVSQWWSVSQTFLVRGVPHAIPTVQAFSAHANCPNRRACWDAGVVVPIHILLSRAGWNTQGQYSPCSSA